MMQVVRTLTAVTRTQGNNEAIKSGLIEPEGYRLSFEEVPVLVHAFRRMVRELAYDVSEMAMTTYLCAREHGVEFTAIPVFLVRAFHHGAIYKRAGSDLSPADLTGTRVGVNRGYTVTTGVWARAVLEEEYGVDPARVTWVLSGDEHVSAYEPPSNVVKGDGRSLEEMVGTGELSAAIGVSGGPGLEHLIPEADERAIDAFETRGHYPINHLIVIRNDVLEEDPALAPALFHAFVRAKESYLERLQTQPIEDLTQADRTYLRLLRAGFDPLPYGVGPNLPMIDSLISHATRQGILRVPVGARDVFASNTLDLVG